MRTREEEAFVALQGLSSNMKLKAVRALHTAIWYFKFSSLKRYVQIYMIQNYSAYAARYMTVNDTLAALAFSTKTE